MKLFDYLDRRSRRNVILGQLKYWRRISKMRSLSFYEIPARLMKVYLEQCDNTEKEIKFYTDKLNELL